MIVQLHDLHWPVYLWPQKTTLYVFVARLSHISCYISKCMKRPAGWLKFMLLPLNKKSLIYPPYIDTPLIFYKLCFVTFQNNSVLCCYPRWRKFKNVPLKLGEASAFTATPQYFTDQVPCCYPGVENRVNRKQLVWAWSGGHGWEELGKECARRPSVCHFLVILSKVKIFCFQFSTQIYNDHRIKKALIIWWYARVLCITYSSSFANWQACVF